MKKNTFIQKKCVRIVAILTCLSVVLSLLSGCNSKSNAISSIGVSENFFTLIENKQFEQVYDMLSAESLTTLTKDSFMAHYKNLLSTLGDDTTISIKPLSFTPTNSFYQLVPFEMTYHTQKFGDLTNAYTLQLNREGELWSVYWTPSLLFPSMDWADNLHIVSQSPTRGEIFASGKLVATNTPGQTVYVLPSEIPDKAKFATAISPYIGLDTQEILELLKKSTLRGHTSATSLNIRSNPSLDSEVLLRVNQGESFEVLNDGVVSIAANVAQIGTTSTESLETLSTPTIESTPTATASSESNESQRLPKFYRVKYKDGAKDIIGYAYAPYVTLYYSQDIIALKAFPPDSLPLSTQQKIKEIKGAHIDTAGMTNYRIYPYGESFFHTVGYISEITDAQIKEYEQAGLGEQYQIGSVIGQIGLERQYELDLRGEKGYELYISNFDGSDKRTLYQKPAKNGEDVHLSIDAELQQYAYDLLRLYLGPLNQTGSVVVNDPQTGAVLAMANYPSLDPNTFYSMEKEEWASLITATDTNYPFINRAINGAYVPGSVFKPFTAAVAMNEGVITSQTVFPYADQIEEDRWTPTLDNLTLQPIKRVENKGRNDTVDFWNSMAYSDNIYFAWTSLLVGQEKFLDYCDTRLGFNESIPFDLPVSQSRVVNAQRDKETKDDPNAILNAFTYELLADSGFGQGQMIMTPLHLSILFGALANNGDVMRPYVVDNLRHSENFQYLIDRKTVPEVWKPQIVDTEGNLQAINKSLLNVMTYGTTAGRLSFSGYTIAAKTGTAEKSKTEDISWLAAYKADGSKDFSVVVAIECPTQQGVGRYAIVDNLFQYDFTHDVGSQVNNVDNRLASQAQATQNTETLDDSEQIQPNNTPARIESTDTQAE